MVPVYLQSLMPTPEDQVDTIATEKSANEESLSAENSQSDLQEGNSNETNVDTPGSSSIGTSSETYENPFLKPAKRIKLKLL